MQENDPDTLQLLDELDTEWVKLWRKAAKSKTESDSLTFVVSTLNKQEQEIKRASRR